MLKRAEIRSRRIAAGLSLSEASIKAGWGYNGRSRWADIEAGRRKAIELSSIEKIARAIGCTVAELISK